MRFITKDFANLFTTDTFAIFGGQSPLVAIFKIIYILILEVLLDEFPHYLFAGAINEEKNTEGNKWTWSCKKVPHALSRCHTKIRMSVRGPAHPSFGMTPTFQNLTLLTS